jgi:hypothetical protein
MKIEKKEKKLFDAETRVKTGAKTSPPFLLFFHSNETLQNPRKWKATDGLRRRRC